MRARHLPPPKRTRQRLDHRVVDPRPRRPWCAVRGHAPYAKYLSGALRWCHTIRPLACRAAERKVIAFAFDEITDIVKHATYYPLEAVTDWDGDANTSQSIAIKGGVRCMQLFGPIRGRVGKS
jgi:hypothetical protein